MTDRFKFRAFYKDFPLCDDEKGDYKKSFMIYNVVVYGGRDVGAYCEQFEDSLSEQGFTEEEIEQVRDFFSYGDYEDWINFWADDVEQCTGLRDKNGKLIYEGDIVHYVKHTPMGIGGDRYAKVFWWDNIQGFAIETNCGDYYGLQDYEIEVVGNIHENPELLEGKENG